MSDKINLKEAFAEYAKKELEFYQSAKRNKVYTRVLPNFKDTDKGSIDFFYNGIVIGGYMYKKTITLKKLRITNVGKEEDVEDAIKAVEDSINKAEMICDNQLK